MSYYRLALGRLRATVLSCLSSWSSQECSSLCQSEDRGFKSHRGRLRHGMQNWQSNEAQTFVTAGSNPACATCRVVILVAACKAVVTKQARWMTRGSIPSQPTAARSSSGRMRDPHSRDAGSSPARVTYLEDDQVMELVDIRRSERRAIRGVGVRLSPWSLIHT